MVCQFCDNFFVLEIKVFIYRIEYLFGCFVWWKLCRVRWPEVPPPSSLSPSYSLIERGSENPIFGIYLFIEFTPQNGTSNLDSRARFWIRTAPMEKCWSNALSWQPWLGRISSLFLPTNLPQVGRKEIISSKYTSNTPMTGTPTYDQQFLGIRSTFLWDSRIRKPRRIPMGVIGQSLPYFFKLFFIKFK